MSSPGLRKRVPAQQIVRRRSNSILPRRKRRLSDVTPHACKECRKKKSKCDGQKPCGRCCKRQIECSYQLAGQSSKADLRAEIDSLHKIITALVRPNELEAGVAHTNTNAALENANSSTDLGLSLDDGKPEITKEQNTRLDVLTVAEEAKSLEGDMITPSNGSSGVANHEDATDVRSSLFNTKPGRKKKIQFPVRHNDRALPLRTSLSATSETWTLVTDNIEVTRHLIALYFCWEYPNFAPISKEHFLRDFHARSGLFCSMLLVNALLSLGCQLSDRFCEEEPGTAFLSGNDFFEEARRLLPLVASRNPFTTIQALGIMSLREARGGRALQSRYYAEQAMLLVIETGLHTTFDERHPKRDVLSKTFWGTFMLNNAWSLTTGVLPYCTRSLDLPPKPAILPVLEQRPWAPYIDGHCELQPHVQFSHVRSVYECFCRLTELVHQALYHLYTPGQVPTGSALLSIYKECLDWYEQLPQFMKLGYNSTPAVIFIHLHYHYFILLLFRKFTKLRILGSLISTRDICVQSARAILALIDSYDSLYTLRRAPAFLPYILFAAGYVYVDSCLLLPDTSAMPSKRDTKIIRQSIEALKKINPSHKIAEHAMSILHDLSSERKMSLRFNGTRALFPSSSRGKDRQDNSELERQEDSNVISNLARTSREEGSTFGLVWLQDNVPVGGGNQIEQAGFAFI